MEDCGDSSSEAPGDKGSCWMKRRMREQQSQHEDGLDLHSLTEERAKALLEYRARCTSARFWIQSELLDLHVGCSDPSCPAGAESQQGLGASAADQQSANGASDPGVVGDLPSLMRRHLTCPLLSKLLQQDPVLSGRLATLDHVLWHRRSKHEPQTSGWMSHDPLCPDSYPLGVPGISQGAPDALAAADAAGASSSASLRSDAGDSMAGAEASSSAPLRCSSTPNKESSHHTDAAKEGNRPVTVWVSCERCMEHFAYIAASLLVFLKPSELRDLAVERQQSNCCGFVFCGRRSVATPEKRRTALWRWTLDLGGSRVLSEDELVQFCCSRCCNRQQQLLRLLDEEPMYARPGIKEWIGDALQRKAAYRPHPHLLTEEETRGREPSSYLQQKERVARPSLPGSASAPGLPERRHPNDVGRRPPVEMDVLLSEGPERAKAQRLVGPLLEKPLSCVSLSTESSSGELARLEGSQSMDNCRVPLIIEQDESSGDEESAADAKKEGDTHTSVLVGKHRERFHGSAAGGQSRKASDSFLMLNYGSGEVPSDPNGMPAPTSSPAPSDSPPGAAASAAETAFKTEASSSSLSRGLTACAASGSAASSKSDEAGATQLKQREQQQQPKQHPPSTSSQAEPPIKSRGSRVRFADDDGEDAEDGEGDGDTVSASLFKHFFNIQDEDDGLGFYHRADRLAAAGGTNAGGQQRNGTGELRSILKPATEPVDPSPSHSSSTAESQMGYMRLSDVVIAFDLLSSCCTEASAAFLAGYHRQFCTCSCEGAVPTGAPSEQTEADDSPKSAAGCTDVGGRGIHSRKDAEADESDSVSCVDGESGDEIEPVDLWRRRQQQLLKAILRSLPPSADNFAPLVTELCETFRPLQPLPTLRCSLCSCLAAVILLLLLLLRARPLTCCCCCECCRPWSNSHERHSRCQRRHPASGASEKGGSSSIEDAAASIYFDDALTLAKEEDVGLALVDFVRSTIHQSAPCSNPHRPMCGGTDASNAADAAEVSSPHHEEKAIHVLLESIFSRMTLPIMRMCSAPAVPHEKGSVLR
ncbi:hypothetical protein Esti_002970 [Eimeria stiedai]